MGVRKLVVAAVATFGALLALASPAGAHTSLVGSEPADRTIDDTPPETLTLEFVNDLDPRSVSVEVKAIDGTTVGAGARTTPDEPATSTIAFDLPALDQGTYGLAWQAVGDDGHRVTGETVVVVGDPADGALAAEVGEAGFSTSDGLDRVFDLGAGLGRSFWYLGLSLLVGASYLLWWRRQAPRGARAGSPTGRELQQSAAWWARTGWLVAVAAAVVEWVIVVASRVRYFDVEGSTFSQVYDAMGSTTALGWALAALAMVCMIWPLSELRAASDGSERRVDMPMLASLVVVAAAWSVVAGHAATSTAPLPDLVSLTAHLVAATLWVGPLAVLSLTAVTASWRSTESSDRRALLTGFFAGYANVAFVAFAVLAVTGAYSAWVTLDGRWFENAYSWTLVGKLALIIAVIVPFALHHDRVVRRSGERDPSLPVEATGRVGGSSARPTAASGAAGSWAFLRSVRLEALALAVVLGLAALLGGLDPGFDATGLAVATDAGDDLFAEVAVTDVSVCAAREIGRPSCYRDYFRSVMEADGADVAVAEIESLSTTDEYVSLDCHQITHDLGQDAVSHYGDLGKALSFEASACWSGYYHGAVETEMSGLDDEALLAAVPTVCNDAAADRYSFSHYNCVHGVGHGLMLRFDADLWRAIPYCEAYDETEAWERRSCLGGAFMQNIVSAQEGESASLRDDDLLYPCTELEGTYREECLGMQTSWVLYKLDYDYPGGFAVCDTLDPASASVCYKSMGRDISGGSRKDVATVVTSCDLGAEAYRESCIVGAALDAVYDDHDIARATALCDAVDERWRAACERARDSAASTF